MALSDAQSFAQEMAGAPMHGREPVPAGTVPPTIFVSTRPAVLVMIEGAPKYAVANGRAGSLWRVVNTRTLLVKDASGRHYLHVYDGFMETTSLSEPWTVKDKILPGLREAEAAARRTSKFDLLEGKPDPSSRKKPSLKKGAPPWVYLSQGPAKLILINGEPDYVSIQGTRLFYARNTTADLFWHQGEDKLYLLSSGRWFRADSSAGPWEVVPADDFPSDFAAIPDSNVKKTVKVSIPRSKAPFRKIAASAAPAASRQSMEENPLMNWLVPTGPFHTPPAQYGQDSPPKQWCR